MLYCFISTLSYICIALFISIWIYRNINISILVLFPFASFLHARRCCVFRKHGETAQEQNFSSLQSSKGERSNIPSGALRTTPHTYYGCCTLSGLPSESKPLPHGLKTTRKEYGILYLCLYLYCRIVILLSISIVYNKAIYIFLYLYFCFRFLCSTSIFLA